MSMAGSLLQSALSCRQSSEPVPQLSLISIDATSCCPDGMIKAGKLDGGTRTLLVRSATRE